jgi:hypothetical protein
MKDEIVKKYVKDLDGLLKELGEYVSQPQIVVGESAVIFLFGRIFRFLNFYEFIVGHNKALENKLDAWAMLENDDKELLVEFEARSKNFETHIKKGDVKPEDYKNTLIVCWDANWKEQPSEIDVFDIEPLWKQAQDEGT